MKNTISIVAIAVILVLMSCNEGTGTGDNQYQKEAATIADSIRDIETLKLHVERYDSLKEREATLLLRQKLGSMLRNISDFDTAINQHNLCIELATQLKDTLQLIIALNNQGTNFRRIGDLEEASIYHYRALELCDKTAKDTSYISRKNMVRTLNGLGNVLLSLGNYEVAEEMFNRALQGEKQLGSLTGQAINLANIGAIKERNGEMDSARIYYSRSMQKNIEGNNLIGISLCHQNLGRLDEMAGNNIAARESYLKSYALGLQNKDIWHWLNPCTSLAALSLKEGNIAEAEKYSNEALDAAIKIKAKSRLGNLYSLQAAIYEAKGEVAKALESTKLSVAYKDSAELEEDRVYTQNMRVRYEINKRKAEVEEAQAMAQYEKKMFNIVFWSSIAVLLLIMLAVAALVRASLERKRANKVLERTNRERQEFYRGITHQLRTPLTIILGMTNELKRFIPGNNDVAQKEFNAVTRKSNELLDLVNEMIEYNRGERAKVEINELPKNETAQTPTDNTLSDSDLHIWGG